MGQLCLNYLNLLLSRQFIEDTSISQFWSISEALNPPPIATVCWLFSGLAAGYRGLKELTDRALYFSVNMKLKIEFIFFCGAHTLEKIMTLCGITYISSYCFQPYDGPEVTFSQPDFSKVECIWFSSSFLPSTFVKLNMICLQAFCHRLL